MKYVIPSNARAFLMETFTLHGANFPWRLSTNSAFCKGAKRKRSILCVGFPPWLRTHASPKYRWALSGTGFSLFDFELPSDSDESQKQTG
jgi:hypothetical protein